MMTREGGSLDWSSRHQCNFVVDKFGIMGLTRKREPNPLNGSKTRPIQTCLIFLQDTKVPVVTTHKFLGIMINQELQWKEHIHYALQNGKKWVTQYCRLAKLSKGLSAKYMRSF